MLDQLDFRLVADKYCEEHQEKKLDQSTVYEMVWWLLSSNIKKPNVSDESLVRLSEYLEEKGYYDKTGRRPKHHNPNFKNLR